MVVDIEEVDQDGERVIHRKENEDIVRSVDENGDKTDHEGKKRELTNWRVYDGTEIVVNKEEQGGKGFLLLPSVLQRLSSDVNCDFQVPMDVSSGHKDSTDETISIHLSHQGLAEGTVTEHKGLIGDPSSTAVDVLPHSVSTVDSIAPTKQHENTEEIDDRCETEKDSKSPEIETITQDKFSLISASIIKRNMSLHPDPMKRNVSSQPDPIFDWVHNKNSNNDFTRDQLVGKYFSDEATNKIYAVYDIQPNRVGIFMIIDLVILVLLSNAFVDSLNLYCYILSKCIYMYMHIAIKV